MTTFDKQLDEFFKNQKIKSSCKYIYFLLDLEVFKYLWFINVQHIYSHVCKGFL